MKESSIKSRANKDGPFTLRNASVIHSTEGNELKTDDKVQLCRCGKSRNKPFCDKSHIEYGFKSKKLEDRQPDIVDRYIGKDITIRDNRGVCSHRGFCTDNLPQVFRQGKEPWIDPNAAPADEIIRVIRMCPSGALGYEKNGTVQTDWEESEEISMKRNGPYEVKGNTDFYDEKGSQPQTSDHYTLCRCGGSKNKPFCDGTHWYNNFNDEKQQRFSNHTEKTAEKHMDQIQHIASTGDSINEPMGTTIENPKWEAITISGAQLSKLPINEDEPVRIETVIGKRAENPLKLSMPVYITHMSYGALSREAKLALSRGSATARTAMCSGEGGVLEESMKQSHQYIFEYVQNEYSFTETILRQCDAVEIKIGQAVKPGIGGHFPARKITDEIAAIRKRSKDQDIITPARYPDIYDSKSLAKKIKELREMAGEKPIGVKIAAGNVEKDLAVILEAEPDFITIDGKGGATGSVNKFIKDSASVPTIMALARARQFLERGGVKDISLIITGGLRISTDFAKAIAMGADAVAIGTAALMAIGCEQYRICNTGLCPTGITTHDPLLRSRIDVMESANRLNNFLNVTKKELETITRMCGVRDIHQLDLDDLSTHHSSISVVTGIKMKPQQSSG